MMPVKQLSIAVIGDEDLVNELRLAGISRYYVIKGDHDTRERVRKTLTELIDEPDIGIVVILEDYVKYVADMIAQVREGRKVTPVIVEVPSKYGTTYPDVIGYYKAYIRKSIGFDVEL